MDKERPVSVIKHTANLFTEAFENNTSLSYVINLDNKRIYTFGGVGNRRKSIDTSYFAIRNSELLKNLWTKKEKQQLVNFHKNYYNFI